MAKNDLDFFKQNLHETDLYINLDLLKSKF